MPSTYFARNGDVFVSDGPWDVRLTPMQVDQLLDIFDSANAVTHFNALYEAAKQAGQDPCDYARKPLLRVVARNEVRSMLEASVGSLDPQPPSAA
jgi:hypothetical protein